MKHVKRLANLRHIAVGQALRPGLKLKRWVVFLLFGAALTGIGCALAILYLIKPLTGGPLYAVITLQFIPWWLRIGLLAGLGLLMIGYGLWRISRVIADAFSAGQEPPGNLAMVNTILSARPRKEGPRIVAIGGGTGMPQLLRGLRAYTDNITAVVTVADDGGSSGRLRRQMGTLPPGDFRNNIAALSDAEGLMTRLLQYRFANRELAAGGRSSELAGHSFGNLFITTMAAVTGSFERGLQETSRVLAVRGRILPSTLESITLCAEVARPCQGGAGKDNEIEWLMVEGESNIPEAGGVIQRVFLKPDQPAAYPGVIQAILQADLILAGPGSFYTSIMPNLLVPAVRDAISAARAPRIYICNVATQPGETDHFSVSDHMAKLFLHAGDAFTEVLANDNYNPTTTPYPNGQWVTLPDPGEDVPYRLHTADLIDSRRPWHHAPEKLAATLMYLLRTRTEAGDG